MFSDPGHVIEYRRKSGKVKEVRQPVNVCLRGRPVGGDLAPGPGEASKVLLAGKGILAEDYELLSPVIAALTVNLETPQIPLTCSYGEPGLASAGGCIVSIASSATGVGKDCHQRCKGLGHSPHAAKPLSALLPILAQCRRSQIA